MLRRTVWMVALALLLACGQAEPPARPADPLSGSWDGDDWGAVAVREDLTGTYAGTFEGSTGDIKLAPQGEGVYQGTWTERVASEGHPLRKGLLTVRLQGAEASVSWQATDANQKRQAKGTSVWKRVESPG